MSKSIRHVVSSIAVGALIAAGVIGSQAGPALAAGSGSIVVDPSVSYQTIQGWGTSLAWWAEGAGGWSAQNRQTLDRALFGLNAGGTGLGLNIVRYDIGAATPGDTCSPYMRVGAATPSFDTLSDSGTAGGGTASWPGTDPTKNYDWTKDPNQNAVLQDAQADGANVFAATAYSAPASMTLNNCSGGSSDGSQNISSADSQGYSDYIATVVKHFHDTVGIPFSTVDPVNEPAGSGWNNKNCTATVAAPNTKCQQGMVVGTTSQGTIVSDLSSDLSGTSYTHIAAPDEVNVTGTLSDYNSYSAAQQGTLSQIDSHNYGDWGASTQSGVPLTLLSQEHNTPLWMSEWGAGADVSDNVENHPKTAAATAALTLSQEILKNENEMHPTAWVAWQGADGPFAGQTTSQSLVNGGGDLNDLWGLAGVDYSSGSNQTVTFPLRYYTMGNYSEFVRPGYRMIRNTDPNTFSAWDQGSNTLVIVATNAGSSSMSTSYDLSRFGLTGATVKAYQTAADTVNGSGGANEKHLAAITSPVLNSSTGSLADTVPAQSVTTYVVSGAAYTGAGSSTEVDDSATGNGTDQWNYTGAGWQGCSGSQCSTPQALYNSTAHADSTASDSASMTFAGGRVRLFGAPDTNGGRATVSIDGGAPTELDFYAAARHGNQLMWESSTLSAGSHTLTVTVSGTRNPLSSGAVVALDRAEVDPAAKVSVDDATIGSSANQWTYAGGGWVHCAATTCADPSDMYANTASWDGTAGDSATLSFTGNSVTLYGMTDTNEGIANVSIDSGAATPVDFYAPTRGINVPIYTRTGLSAGTHTLTVTATNQRDSQSSGTVPVIDRAVIGSILPAISGSVTSIDDSIQGAGTNQWSYTGSWQRCSGTPCGDPANLFGGSTTWDATANDTATISFGAVAAPGTTIGLYGVTDTNEGKADVSVDGGTPTVVDFYSAARHGDQLLWHADDLAPGNHTLTVKPLGTKDTASTGALVALDRATIGVTPMLTTVAPGTLRNNFSGSVGMHFTTGATGLTVTALGRMHVSGNTGSHTLGLYTADGTLVAGATLNTQVANVDAQAFQYAALAQPVTLAPNTSYYVVSSESNGGDQWYDANSTATLVSGSGLYPAYLSGSTWTSYPADPGQMYGPVSVLGG